MTVSITGASGFIGSHLLAALAHTREVETRALGRAQRPQQGSTGGHLLWQLGDLEDPEALRALMAREGTLVHLAYPRGWAHERHLAAAARIGDLARQVGVKRIVLCSTAVVAGRTPAVCVTEATPCVPSLDYERTKLEIEHSLAEKAAGAFELAVLRPTAVFGPGGQNLLKLATALTDRAMTVNYLQSSLFGRRRMNLVCVENVVAALLFLVERDQIAAVDTYIVSDDDDPLNNFHDVEAALIRHLGLGRYPFPPIPLPAPALTGALRLAGRTSTNPSRVYDGARLVREGCRKSTTFAEGLARFADWFRRRR
jgi:nucleoside-diphosphate-sugar epimerase